jgi:hypothetical protein
MLFMRRMAGTAPSAVRQSLFRQWGGPAAIVAAAVFVLGRLALEPLRPLPHFDMRGMEAFSSTETYLLRKQADPVEVAFFGSSQSVWAVLPEIVARELEENPVRVRNLAVEGGTPFDMWNLIRRNEEKLKNLRIAIVEVNPFVLKQGLDSDPRVAIDVAQHGTVPERLMLAHREDRVKQLAEWVLPVLSVRRSLESTFLDAVDPDPGNAIYPCPEQRTHPAVGWKADGKPHLKKERETVMPLIAARRMVGGWRLSKLQDYALRQSLGWFAQHGVRVIFHELPVHPEVMDAIHHDPGLERGQENYRAYLDTLEPKPFARSLILDPPDCAITADEMADRTHLNERGARIYSAHLAAKVHSFLVQGS